MTCRDEQNTPNDPPSRPLETRNGDVRVSVPTVVRGPAWWAAFEGAEVDVATPCASHIHQALLVQQRSLIRDLQAEVTALREIIAAVPEFTGRIG